MTVETITKNKFLADSQMSFQQVYDFAFKNFIPLLKNLAAELGEDHFLETLKEVTFDAALQGGQDGAKNVPCNDLATLTDWAKDPNHFWKHVLTFEIVKDTAKIFEVRISECLWAKTFLENEAADIGYALLCHPDYACCQGFNPKIKMKRSKTLMQGDDYCNHCWVWEK